jgi:hypothetical protein
LSPTSFFSFFSIFLIAFEIWTEFLLDFVISKIWQIFHPKKEKRKKVAKIGGIFTF